MANTKFLGTDLMVYIGAVPVANSRSATFKMSQQLADSTTKDSDGAFTEFIPSIKSWELSTEGLAVWGATDQFSDAIINGTALTVQFKPKTATTGNVIYSGTVYVESYEITGDNGEVVTYSVNFKGSGKLSVAASA